MSKKRHKPNLHHNQKEVSARHRNDFFKRLDIFCRALTGEDVLKLIPRFNQNLIYFAHTRPIIAEAAEGQDIPPRILEAVKVIVNSQLKQMSITIEKTNKTVPLSEYYTLGLTLFVHFLTIDNLPYKNSEKVKALLMDTCGSLEFLFDILYDKLHDEIFPYLTLLTNHLCLYYFSYGLETLTEDDKGRFGAKFKIVVKKYPAEKIPIVIDNNTRQAYRIGHTFKDNVFEWIHVTPSQLGINSVSDNQQIPVYIQMHALQRLLERIDCFHPAYLLSGIYTSLLNCNIINDNNRFIIEFTILQVKVGYLSAVMIHGKLVIRTFLFLTFNGTPEGKRLEDFVGLKKLDTKYLKMDRLSTFMTSKLSANQELRSIFEKADCIHLVELYDKLDKFSSVHRENSPIEMLTSYLNTNEIKLADWTFEEVNE